MYKKGIQILRSKELYSALIRYYLVFTMIPYAISKIMQTQFVLLPFSYWQMPLEKLSGKNIAWAFLGYSPWFQVLLGVLEFLPALLLLFRRTALLGGILLLPMTLNVVLINYALDLWSITKQISLTLLILNLLVLVFDWQRIKKIIELVLEKGKKTTYLIWECLFCSVFLSTCLYFSMADLLEYKKEQSFLTGKWINNQPYEWTLVSEKINDSLQNPRLQKSYFGAYGDYGEINADGFIQRDSVRYELDKSHHMLTLVNNVDSSSKNYSYSMLDGNILQLKLTIDSLKGTTLTQQFKRRIINLK